MPSESNNGATKRLRRRKPALSELADAGAVDHLYQMISTSNWTLLDVPSAFRHLFHAIEKAAKGNPITFAAGVFRRMIALNVYLLLRAHIYAEAILTARDSSRCGPSDADPFRDLAERILPQLHDLQHHVSELLLYQANTIRTLELAHDVVLPLEGCF